MPIPRGSDSFVLQMCVKFGYDAQSIPGKELLPASESMQSCGAVKPPRRLETYLQLAENLDTKRP
jgi:hypothetical protein